MRTFLFTTLIFFAGFFPIHADSDRLLKSLKPAGYVSDFAQVMSSSDRAATETLLRELEQKTGAEVAVVTLKSLEGGQIDDFANRLFAHWGIGKKGKDKGLLLIAAIEDRKVRIETGYGFEGALPDAAAGRLIDQNVLPAFRNGNYSGGLRKGAEALAAMAASASGVELTKIQNQKQLRSFSFADIPPLIIILAIICGWIVFLFCGVRFGGEGSSGGFGSNHSSGGFSGGYSGGGHSFGGGCSGGGGSSRSW